LSEGVKVESVAFSPNGRTLAVGDWNGDVGLWDTSSSQRTATLSESSTAFGVAFSPNGRTLAVGDNSGDIGLWDTSSGQRTATLSEGSVVTSVAFSPNGQTLAAGESNGTAGFFNQSLWNWSFPSMKHLLCSEVGSNMARVEWVDYVPNQPYQKTCPGYPL
jgi:WD40 repeat protein